MGINWNKFLKTNQLTNSADYTKTQTIIFWEQNLTRNKAISGCAFKQQITNSFTMFFQNTSSVLISCSTFNFQCSHELKLQQTSFILDKVGISSLLSVHSLCCSISFKKTVHKWIWTFQIQTLPVSTQYSPSGSAAKGGCFLGGFYTKMILNAKRLDNFKLVENHPRLLKIIYQKQVSHHHLNCIFPHLAN